jgi:hypothetical protein
LCLPRVATRAAPTGPRRIRPIRLIGPIRLIRDAARYALGINRWGSMQCRG